MNLFFIQFIDTNISKLFEGGNNGIIKVDRTPSSLLHVNSWSGQKCKSRNTYPDKSIGVPGSHPTVKEIQEALQVSALPFFLQV
tara:strand:- start:811 stop:1062 length:252 start_codon:yes stop_codon:yes gene_type:complete